MVDFRDKVNKILKHCTKNFGEDVQYYPSSGGTYCLRAIFDNDFQTVDPETEQVVSSNQSVIGVNLNDTNFELKTNDQVKVRNLMYKVIEVREDGQGGAQLLLHKCENEKKVFKKKGARSS